MKNRDLINKIIAFRQERDWGQYHSLKDLCLGLGIEVAELQEMFLWKTDNQIKELVVEKKEQIADELADIFTFLAYLSHDLGIDLDRAVIEKLAKNSKKYPIDKSKGSNKKYTEL